VARRRVRIADRRRLRAGRVVCVDQSTGFVCENLRKGVLCHVHIPASNACATDLHVITGCKRPLPPPNTKPSEALVHCIQLYEKGCTYVNNRVGFVHVHVME
jgi:hypothetical protein